MRFLLGLILVVFMSPIVSAKNIEVLCQNKDSVSVMKFYARYLGGDSHLFYDCSSKKLLLDTGNQSNLEVQFSYGMNPHHELYIYIPGWLKEESDRARKLTVMLTEDPVIVYTYNSIVDATVINGKRKVSLSKYINNFDFLNSITNVPGWPDYDNL
jgi:hypothetical protein